MNYSLNAGEWNSVFAVPSGVVDKYIKIASGNSLKLLLFLLRHGGTLFSSEELRDKLGFRREGELEDAALFWVQRGIIRADSGTLEAASDDIPVQQMLPEIEIQPELPKKRNAALKVNQENAAVYTAGFIGEQLNKNPELQWLYNEAEKLYGRGLQRNESQTVLMMVEHFGLPVQVAAMLLKYCFKIDKAKPAYIQEVAKSWADDNVTTVSEADERIARLEKRYSVTEQLRSAMEMKTKFTAKQTEFITRWSEEYSFNVDMIILAHEITLNNTGSMNFNYTNKILENWYKGGIMTKEAVQQESASFKSAKKESTAVSSIDTDSLHNSIMQKYLNKDNQ